MSLRDILRRRTLPLDDDPDPDVPAAPVAVADGGEPVIRFEERCQALADERICGTWADRFCVVCSLQVCGRCLPHHRLLYARMGALHVLHCDGRQLHAPME